MIKTIFFILFIYFVIRTINRMFFPASRQRRNNGFFYSSFQSNSQQQQQQQASRTQSSGKKNFDQIEEAEFEDITDKAETGTEDTDQKDRS